METTTQTGTAKRIVMVQGLDGEPICDHKWADHSTGSITFARGEVIDTREEGERRCAKCGIGYARPDDHTHPDPPDSSKDNQRQPKVFRL